MSTVGISFYYCTLCTIVLCFYSFFYMDQYEWLFFVVSVVEVSFFSSLVYTSRRVLKTWSMTFLHSLPPTPTAWHCARGLPMSAGTTAPLNA